LPRALRNLPPLLDDGKPAVRMIGIGFVLLTLTLVSGILFSEEIFGKVWQFNHKVLFGFVSWCVFAMLLWGHRFYGWRGKIAVRWTVSGFIFFADGISGKQVCAEVDVAPFKPLGVSKKTCYRLMYSAELFTLRGDIAARKYFMFFRDFAN